MATVAEIAFRMVKALGVAKAATRAGAHAMAYPRHSETECYWLQAREAILLHTTPKKEIR